MKKIKNITLIVLSIALLGLWSCNKAQSFESAATESSAVAQNVVEGSAPDIEDSDYYDITRSEDYNEFLAIYRPWSSLTMEP
jgi:hypothetical protein